MQDTVWRLRNSDAIYQSVTTSGVFSSSEINLLKEYANSIPTEKPQVIDKSNLEKLIVNDKVRICEIKWLNPTDVDWLYRKLVDIIHKVNSEVFNLNLYGIQQLQYTIYNAADQGFYGAHRDVLATTSGGMLRKLSFSLQLTDPTEYEGGELIIDSGIKPHLVSKELGDMHFFLSDLVHEARPVTKGSRHVLVGWVVGPPLV